MIDETLWQQGWTIPEFVEQMDENQKAMQTRLRDIRLTPFECQLFREYTTPTRVLVLTESGCSDNLMNLPVLAKIAECAPEIQVRVFIRSGFPQLRSHFEGQGFQRIPLFVFMHPDFQPIGSWMERPRAAHRLIREWKEEHPQYEQIEQDPALSPEERKQRIQPLSSELREAMWDWYDTGLQSETVREIADLLQVRR